MDEGLTVDVVYLDEGAEEGGIAHPTQDLIGALEDRIRVRETLITQNRAMNPGYWYRLGRRASRGADVVHVQFEYGSFGSIGGQFLGCMFPVFAHAVDVPLVATLHNFRDRRVEWTALNPRSVVRLLVENATWFVDRSLVNRASFFIPLMKEEEDRLRRHGVPTDRIEYIPLVPDSDPTRMDASEAKRALGLESRRVLTAFGWVRRSKGYDRVIDILPEFPDDVVFLVAGGTRTDEQEEYLDELKSQVRVRGLEDRVRFTGYVGRDEHPTILSATDIMVFPYRDNRASDALARALAYRIPVVTSDNAEFSYFEREWGCVETATDDAELQEVLMSLLANEDERARLRRNADRFTEAMNWETVADKMVDVYHRVVDIESPKSH